MNRDKFSPLALTRHDVRHPFRQSLPIEIVQIARQQHVVEAAAMSKEKGRGEDVSLFCLSFLAFFTAFYMFIV